MHKVENGQVWYKDDEGLMVDWIHWGSEERIEFTHEQDSIAYYACKKWSTETNNYELDLEKTEVVYSGENREVTEGVFSVPIENKELEVEYTQKELDFMSMQAELYETQVEFQLQTQEALATIYEALAAQSK